MRTKSYSFIDLAKLGRTEWWIPVLTLFSHRAYQYAKYADGTGLYRLVGLFQAFQCGCPNGRLIY